MNFSLNIVVPDGTPPGEVIAYLAEQSDNLVGQLQTGIIELPAVDEQTFVDYGQVEGREAYFMRSE